MEQAISGEAHMAEQVRLAKKALQLKRTDGKGISGPSYQTASKGMRNLENEKPERLLHPTEIGRVSQFIKDGQARRDSHRAGRLDKYHGLRPLKIEPSEGCAEPRRASRRCDAGSPQ